ncbi:rRNA adenine dimethylase [Wallemia mellicola]|uniref:rRNA adenine N(6)-methyltransferase n=1 Tax=Wallemia mellicola TaxID=1708541 RepID=A0A4T0P3S3_9BASI|nr:rRNA adenine dimethylase [Wallemia mellicola]TIC04752.1 rRNA adenine dimethylase [Wallemia mellicola]TIC11961.1 rRNA adenine dimethylase [Wallemia mellicola]TIC14252.1 rRNA adenine dimethylase [Wallemia mellicola]TIC32740.1 rRNA adenine dimethylase [Wallemia mellicola]
MPKALKSATEKFSRSHQPAAKSDSNSGGTSNPLFNTDRFGQHILKNPLVAQAIVDKASLRATDKVFEIGPGTGNLTARILEKAKSCQVIEMDPRMAAELSKRFQGKPEQRRLEIVIGDFVKADLPFFDVVVAILMFQREFALRLCARPGTEMWCRLSANAQLYSKIDHIMKVSKGNFRPPPQVESSVVRIVPLDPPPPVKFEEFDGLTRVLFTRRNKTCRSNFTAAGVYDMLESNRKAWLTEKNEMIDDSENIKSRVERILVQTGFAESRAAKMDVDDFLKLLSAFHDENIHFG